MWAGNLAALDLEPCNPVTLWGEHWAVSHWLHWRNVLRSIKPLLWDTFLAKLEFSKKLCVDYIQSQIKMHFLGPILDTELKMTRHDKSLISWHIYLHICLNWFHGRGRKRNKVTTRWEGPQSLSYHQCSMSKVGTAKSYIRSRVQHEVILEVGCSTRLY